MSRRTLTSALAALWLPAAALAQAPSADAPAAAAAAETQRPLLPGVKLPELSDLKLGVPRPVQAVGALVGLGRPRLALVIGNSRLGNELALGAAARDTQAVAAALRAGGFIVMVREDLGLDDLRANLKEFHDRLQPDSVGFLYFTGLGLQLDGRNLLLPRSGPGADAKATALPLQELFEAAQGPAGSPRFVVVDAAFAHPAVAGLPKPGLAPQTLAPGVMALFAQAPDAALAPATPEALPQPAPSDPRLIAASPFARELVRSLLTPRRSGAEVLRQARNAVADASQGRQSPWIAGDSSDKDDFAEPSLLDAFLPRTPEELAREAARLAARAATSRSTVAAATTAAEAVTPTAAPAPTSPRTAPVSGVPGAVAGVPAAAAGAAATASAEAGVTLLPSAVGAAGRLASAAVAVAAAAGDMPVSAFASPPPPPPKPAQPAAPPVPAPAQRCR